MVAGAVPSRSGHHSLTSSWLPPIPPDETIVAAAETRGRARGRGGAAAEGAARRGGGWVPPRRAGGGEDSARPPVEGAVSQGEPRVALTREVGVPPRGLCRLDSRLERRDDARA